MAQTAEGALDQIASNLQRINELAIQSANGTYDAAARAGLQKEVDQLTQEINRIIETTEFNGEPLLSQESTSKLMQIGFRDNANSQITTGLEGGIHGTLNLDADVQQFVINGSSRVFDLKTDTTATPPADLTNGTIGGVTQNPAVLIEANRLLAEQFGVETSTAGNTFVLGGETGGLAADLATAIAGVRGTDDTQTITHNGLVFSVVGTNATTANEWTVTATYPNGDPVTLGAPLDTASTAVAPTAAALADVVIGGANEPLEAQTQVRVYPENALTDIMRGGLTSTLAIDISTQEGAQVAITQTRNAIDFVSEQRATFGAVMNRFEAVISGNNIYAENLAAARSRIQDADFAVETSNLARQQVLQQAGVASLSQANQASQVILNLL